MHEVYYLDCVQAAARRAELDMSRRALVLAPLLGAMSNVVGE